MVRRRIALLVTALAGGALIVALTGAAAANPKLTGTVGPSFKITLTKGGKKVSTLKPGKYTLVVSDKSPIHNFELEGPGVKGVETDVSETGTKTFTINLKKGTFTFYCKPHEATMHGSFKVT